MNLPLDVDGDGKTGPRVVRLVLKCGGISQPASRVLKVVAETVELQCGRLVDNDGNVMPDLPDAEPTFGSNPPRRA
jgi:hypothetical protein